MDVIVPFDINSSQNEELPEAMAGSRKVELPEAMAGSGGVTDDSSLINIKV